MKKLFLFLFCSLFSAQSVLSMDWADPDGGFVLSGFGSDDLDHGPDSRLRKRKRDQLPHADDPVVPKEKRRKVIQRRKRVGDRTASLPALQKEAIKIPDDGIFRFRKYTSHFSQTLQILASDDSLIPQVKGVIVYGGYTKRAITAQDVECLSRFVNLEVLKLYDLSRKTCVLQSRQWRPLGILKNLKKVAFEIGYVFGRVFRKICQNNPLESITIKGFFSPFVGKFHNRFFFSAVSNLRKLKVCSCHCFDPSFVDALPARIEKVIIDNCKSIARADFIRRLRAKQFSHQVEVRFDGKDLDLDTEDDPPHPQKVRPQSRISVGGAGLHSMRVPVARLVTIQRLASLLNEINLALTCNINLLFRETGMPPIPRRLPQQPPQSFYPSEQEEFFSGLQGEGSRRQGGLW